MGYGVDKGMRCAHLRPLSLSCSACDYWRGWVTVPWPVGPDAPYGKRMVPIPSTMIGQPVPPAIVAG